MEVCWIIICIFRKGYGVQKCCSNFNALCAFLQDFRTLAPMLFYVVYWKITAISFVAIQDKL